MTKYEVEQLSNMQALKKYFETGHKAKPLTMGELKELTSEDRNELGALAKAALMEAAPDCRSPKLC